MTEQPTVRCPGCTRTQSMRQPDSIYRCDKCSAQFDGDPDEGGDYSNDPVRSAVQKEWRQRRKVG